MGLLLYQKIFLFLASTHFICYRWTYFSVILNVFRLFGILNRRVYSGSATVSVTVNDVNDNVPTFTSVSYHRYVTEQSVPSTTVINLGQFVTDNGYYNILI